MDLIHMTKVITNMAGSMENHMVSIRENITDTVKIIKSFPMEVMVTIKEAEKYVMKEEDMVMDIDLEDA